MKAKNDRTFAIGILWGASFLVDGYDQPGMAGDLIRQTYSRPQWRWVQKVAREEEFTFPRGFWTQEVFRVR